MDTKTGIDSTMLHIPLIFIHIPIILYFVIANIAPEINGINQIDHTIILNL